jgi:microcystin-dependent protein
MDNGYLGEIRLFAANFEPQGWAFCRGQILSIQQNTALFSLLGTVYGGNGSTTFALPNLQGRALVGTGVGSYVIGETAGAPTTTLISSNLPPHNHTSITGTITMPGTSQAGNTNVPTGHYFANDGTQKYDVQNDGVAMQPFNVNLSVNSAGSGTPINNMMPYLVMNYIICIAGGTYPSRN